MTTKAIICPVYVVVLLVLTGCGHGPISKNSTTINVPSIPDVTNTMTQEVLPLLDHLTDTPTSITSTITPKHTMLPTREVSGLGLSGDLYLWTYQFPDPLYTSINVSKNDHDPALDFRVSPDPMTADGRKTIGLAFAPYSHLVSYLTLSSDKIDLWISDLDLTKIEHAWTSEQHWLDNLSTPEDASIRWGPAEKSIIISSNFPNDYVAIYSLTSKEVMESKGTCDQIAPLPDTTQLTVWCSLEGGDVAPYVYLGLEGEIIPANTKPEGNLEVYEWAFAPDGKGIIYAPKQGNVIVVNQRGTRLEIPARILEEPRFGIKPYLQWSEKGDRLLVYAHNEKYCPLWEDPAFGTLIDKECWLVLDAKTGEFLWSPNASDSNINRLTGVPLTQLASHCAGLSPDGNWVAICLSSGAINSFLVISISGHDVIELGIFSTLDFKWVDSSK